MGDVEQIAGAVVTVVVLLDIPMKALQASGARVDVLSLRHGSIRGVNLHEPASRVHVDKTIRAGRGRRGGHGNKAAPGKQPSHRDKNVGSFMPARRREPLARETDKNLRAGMTPEEARRRASIAFGSVSEFKEGVRDADDLVPWFGAFDTEATAPLRGSRRQRHRRRSRLTWNC